MQKRTGYTLLVVALVVCALAVAVYLRVKAPPEAARLLPESDAIVFLNLKPLRAATHFDRTPVAPSASLAEFTQATGIVPERDLNEAAFALHRMPDPHGPNGPVAFSEVFHRSVRLAAADEVSEVHSRSRRRAMRITRSTPFPSRTAPCG